MTSRKKMFAMDRSLRSGLWLVGLLALALVCVVRPSRADEKSDLISRIEDKLEDAADALERLPDDSNDGAIDRARSYVSEARRYADDLGKVAGGDSDARRIADRFADTQDDFNDATNSLRQIKAGMRQAEPVAAQCVDREKELVRRAREYESKNNPDGLTDLPKEANAIQDAVKRQLDELRRHDDRMDDWADDADDFRAEDPWRKKLVSTVAQTARRSLENWRKSLEQTRRTCENLTKGVEHPDLRAVLSKLGASAGGRKTIIEQLNRDARELASVLANVSEDSGMGSVNRAKGLLANIESGVENLRRTPTTDKETKLIVEKWPDGIRQLKEALDDLEDLKVHQHDMDPLPERCAGRQRELQEMISRNGDDSDGIDDIEKLAETLAEPVRNGMKKAEELMREEEADLRRAKEISFSEGPWSNIRSAQQRDAEETFKTYEENYEKTTTACENVLKGKDGPIVNAAIERLRKRASETGDTLDREVADWIESARRTYILDCKAMEDLWQAYCGTDFEPRGDDGPKARAEQTGAEVQERMQRAMAPVLSNLKQLKPRVQALARKRATKSRGESMLAAIAKEEARLKRLMTNDVWRGNNKILLQYANRYGEDRHRDEWRSRGCKVPTSETSYAYFPGGTHTKPDCIIARSGQCEVWEFKPNSDEGRAEGEKQRSDYRKYVPRYYTEMHRRDGTPSDANGGKAFLKELRKYCLDESSNEIRFHTIDVFYYKMCDKQYVCEN